MANEPNRREEEGNQKPLPALTLGALSFVFFAALAAVAVAQRNAPGLPDVLVDVQLGGKMKINTANGPMLLNVGKHMQCQQCSSTGFTQKGLSQLAQCPCKVAVGGEKDGVFYSGVIHVTRTDKGIEDNQNGAEVEPQEEVHHDSGDNGHGCKTKPLHLRLTAKGGFLDKLPVFAGDARTEAMLRQLFEYFGPDKQNGLVLDGTLTEWDLEHPDYLIPKPGYPSDVAVKIPYGSTLRPLKNKLAPFKTEIPESLRQQYGDGPGSSKLRQGLLAAMQNPLFQRDSAQYRTREAAAPSDARSAAETARSDEEGGRRESMRAMLRRLAGKVDRIADKTKTMDSTLSKVRNVMSWEHH